MKEDKLSKRRKQRG